MLDRRPRSKARVEEPCRVFAVEFVRRDARVGMDGTGIGEIDVPIILIVWLLLGAAITGVNFANAFSLTYRSSISACSVSR